MMNSEPLNRRWVPYYVEFAGALVAYGVFLFVSITVLKTLPADSIWRIPIALLPMLPAAGVVAAVVRQLGRVDELQRRQLLESLSIAFAGSALATFGYGFLENIGFPHISWFFVWTVMGALWLVGSFVTYLRYR
jgi:hypothetical protein